MRKSRLLLAGVAVAAAAVATSAFTAGNTVPGSVAVTGQGAVTGATVTDIHYVANAVDGTVVDAVEFSLDHGPHRQGRDHDPEDHRRHRGRRRAVTACSVKTAWDLTEIVMTCDTTASHPELADFDSVGVTVVHET